MKISKLIELLKQSENQDSDALLYLWDNKKGWMMAQIDKVGYHDDSTLISGDLTPEEWQNWEN